MAADPGLILGATALGGAISFSTTYAMARRGERAAARATGRLLRDDLLLGASMTRVALETSEWWIHDFSLPTRSWHEDRGPLALFLSDAEWRIVAHGFHEMAITNGALGEMHADPDLTEPVPVRGEPARQRLAMTQQAVLDAYLVLQGFNRPSRLEAWTESALRLTRRSRD